CLVELGWNDLLRRRHLADHAAELGEEQGRNVELASRKHGQNLVRNLLCLGEPDLLDFAEVERVNDQLRILPTQDIVALAAHGQYLDGLALRDQLGGMLSRQTCDRRVETAGETP